MSYPPALALTLAVEVPVYVAALTAAAAPGVRRTAAAAVLVNLVTHPLLWWFLGRAAALPGAAYWPLFAGAESAVCLVEGALVARLLRLRGTLPYAASAAANAASVLAGLLVLT
ncbi:MAG: hypothetical protein FWE15_20260 [Actinomycetia bacterium]|nr:hypothetical protein [Actinomycetes bacterium]MCL2732343.1 hypothetical protein [Actinomycetes bacterium]